MHYRRSTLSQGVRVISERMDTVRSVSVGLWVGVGSRDEAKEGAGVSHFLEHLLFKGTKSYSAQRIAEIFDTMGGELNAFSSKEYTMIYARFLDDHMEEALDIIVEMFLEPLIDQADIDSERGVILEEINMYEDTPDDTIHDIALGALFDNHPLGNRVLGEAAVVSMLNEDDIRGYFRTHYLPKSLVVAAAGNVDHDELCSMIEGRFRKRWPKVPERHLFEPKVKAKTIFTPKQTEQYHTVMAWKGLPRSSKERFALSVMDNVLGVGMSSRLFQEVREKRGLVYSVYSYHMNFADAGVMAVYAGTSGPKAKETIGIIKKEIGRLAAEGISEEELYRSKEHIKGSLVLGMESTSNRMSRLGKAELCQGEILSAEEVVQRVDAVTIEDVQELATRIFDMEHRVLAVTGPDESVVFGEL